jgi:hypothetical protein
MRSDLCRRSIHQCTEVSCILPLPFVQLARGADEKHPFPVASDSRTPVNGFPIGCRPEARGRTLLLVVVSIRRPSGNQDRTRIG